MTESTTIEMPISYFRNADASITFSKINPFQYEINWKLIRNYPLFKKQYTASRLSVSLLDKLLLSKTFSICVVDSDSSRSWSQHTGSTRPIVRENENHCSKINAANNVLQEPLLDLSVETWHPQETTFPTSSIPDDTSFESIHRIRDLAWAKL